MKYRLVPSTRVRAMANRMTFRQALTQVCCPLLNFEASETYGGAHLGGGPRDEVVARIQRLNAVSDVPPLCTADLECGAGSMLGLTAFPDLMALGANDSEQLAYEVGKVTALEGRSLGLHWTFSPCVDIAALPDSPVVSTRSAGQSLERVVKTCRGYMRGLQDYGLIATLKHFPGDGYTTFDQHLTTVQSPLTIAEWWQEPGEVYRQLIEAGAKTIMAGHIALPAYDQPDRKLGSCPPATLSQRLLTDLLRGELGFEGLVVSDAMGMGGAAGFMNPFESYARFLEAGGDCVLFARVTDRRFHEEMESLVQKGLLKEETVYSRASRMLALKEDLHLFDDRGPPSMFDSSSHAALAQRVVDGSVTLVRDRTGVLPRVLTPSTRVLHVVVANDYEEHKAAYDGLSRALAQRCSLETWVDPGPHRVFERLRDHDLDLVVCSVGATPSWGVAVARLHGPVARNLMEGWMRLGTPVIFVSHFHPFVHLEYDALMDCVINTYKSLDVTGERVVRGITGEAPFTGKL
jgi:beta-N-acetylhexosaminidase